ncbi:MAG TPA: serine/threonine-protein kinase [Edaphobacter sp.]|jgi:serine/threonine-protein kinase|nr:serine/threonine-protein kinase [Edaphobacter sp.]
MIPEVGQRFGPYEILGKLGGGGMGLVFRAWDQRLHREVAIKLLHDDYTISGMRERFLQEARAASALNHPNICTVFDIGEQDNNPYLVMELLEGETLKDRVARGALPAEEIVRYGIEISHALAVAHAKGIVHRDIKPANIFLVRMPDGKSQAKVLDFGLAKIELNHRGGLESRRLDLTLAGATVGTLSYMSPEQARGESLDSRSDLFSLGIVLYEMATRQVPFRGTTSALMFVQLFSHDPEPVRSWNEEIPRELEKVILKLLAKERKARFQTTQELRDALVKVGKKLGRVGWLNKGAAPVVPLVRTHDPVAWHKGPRRGQSGTRAKVLWTIEGSAPSSGSVGIRPPRVLDKDGGGSEAVQRRSERGGALAVESGEMPSRLGNTPGAVAGGSSAAVAELQRVEIASATARPVWRPEPVLTHSRMVLDKDVDENILGRVSIETAAEDGADEELIAASLAVDAQTRIRIAVVAVAIVIGVAVVAVLNSGLFRPLVLGLNDHLLLTVIQNKTGDKNLDGTVMEGIEIALRQSRSLNVLGGEAYRAGGRQIATESGRSAETISMERVAQKLGAKAYLYGEITRSGTSYTINVDVLKTDSNDKVATLEETAATRERIPAAIGRLARDIREEVSDDSADEAHGSVALELEATTNVNALHAYTLGEEAMESGHPVNALAAYQEAAALDPKFAQVQMRLAWLYRSEKAEVAAANAAELARGAAGRASEKVKLLTQFCFEMNATGDYGGALKTIREYVARYPHDVDGMRGLALALRVQGLLPQALQAAEKGYEEHPFDAETYAEGELALIEMDRYDEALLLEARAQHLGVLPHESVLVADYLAGKEDAAKTRADAMQVAFAGTTTAGGAPVSRAELYEYGLYLDGIGKTGAGSELWRVTAAVAGGVPELASTQASMLAQGALDRALTESCSIALEMVDDVKSLPKGPVASFKAGMAAALCGDQEYAEKTIAALQKSYPQSTAVAQYYVPQLQAAAEIGVNEPEKALDTLIALEQRDQVSLAPYLRGMANAALGQMPAAIVDFRIAQAHRGSSLLLSGDLYPMADLGIARAHAASRNKAESVEGYRRFLTLWKEADRGQPLLAEAMAKSR